ncbi:Serpin domain-containing protein [Baffinella frigidus]|nr:Serpin domain-containing protein [Cryptophyta sp. CCMP2293]
MPNKTEQTSNPVTAFGCTLVKEIFSHGTHNVALSPYSIWTALAMTECATVEGSDASNQMGALLRYDCVVDVDTPERNKKLCKWYVEYRKQMDVQDDFVKIHTANAIFARANLDHDFKQTCEKQFMADAIQLTNKTAINQFVARNTNDLIREIVKEEPKGDAVLVNAVFFKATWNKRFDPDLTTNGDFKPFDGNSVKCRMMTMEMPKIQLSMTQSYQLVKLDYGTLNQFSAFIASPHTHRYESGKANEKAVLDRVVDELFGSDTSWTEATSRLQLQTARCLCIPQFTAEGGVDDLKEYMERQGVAKVFLPGGLHNLTDTHMDCISQISHKAVIQVDESGTTAAAVTVVQTTRSISAGPPQVIFDRPFIFTVVHNTTNTLLFAARVNSV